MENLTVPNVTQSQGRRGDDAEKGPGPFPWPEKEKERDRKKTQG